MNITNVNIKKVETEGKVKALASITLDNNFAIHEIRIVESNGKTFVSMPSKRNQNGEFKDIVHPTNNQTRKEIEEAVLSKYNDVMNGRYNGNRRY